MTLRIPAPLPTKRLIQAAASTVGKSVSEFTIESARSAAIDVLLEQRTFLFDPAQSAAFLRVLDYPAPAGPKLKALMKRRPAWRN